MPLRREWVAENQTRRIEEEDVRFFRKNSAAARVYKCNKRCCRACLGLVMHITIRDANRCLTRGTVWCRPRPIAFTTGACNSHPLARSTDRACRCRRIDRARHGRSHAARLPRPRASRGACAGRGVRRFVDDACPVAEPSGAVGDAASAVLPRRECVRHGPPSDGQSGGRACRLHRAGRRP